VTVTAFSDHVVYVDESGDHGLINIDSSYPVFILAFCIFQKQDYCEMVVPAVQRLKFEHFGHDQIVFHEREIRRGTGPFRVLHTAEKKAGFVNSITHLIEAAPFTLIAAVIDKPRYAQRYAELDNCYHRALGFGLERVFYFLRSSQDHERVTHVVVERRGKREDAQLELEFLRICGGGNYNQSSLPFEIAFADKKTNSTGMQFADLIARPVGMNAHRPEQPNRAFTVIEPKFYRSPYGKVSGFGLKRFP